MKEYPILFNAEMIKAILEGRKTQTRRIVKPQPKRFYGISGLWLLCERLFKDNRPGIKCPYGKVGDRLWVRETFRITEPTFSGGESVYYRADEPWNIEKEWGWKPSIYMPRWACRIRLEIVGVRVERVQDITEEDSISEGIKLDEVSQRWIGSHDKKGNVFHFSDPCPAFINLWDSINEKRGFGWDVNPYVWVVEFKRI